MQVEPIYDHMRSLLEVMAFTTSDSVRRLDRRVREIATEVLGRAPSSLLVAHIGRAVLGRRVESRVCGQKIQTGLKVLHRKKDGQKLVLLVVARGRFTTIGVALVRCSSRQSEVIIGQAWVALDHDDTERRLKMLRIWAKTRAWDKVRASKTTARRWAETVTAGR